MNDDATPECKHGRATRPASTCSDDGGNLDREREYTSGANDELLDHSPLKKSFPLADEHSCFLNRNKVGSANSSELAGTGASFKEDLSPVTRKELYGWLGYSWASDVYSVSSIVICIPIILESLASANGVTPDDYTTPCDTSVQGYKCVVRLGNVWVDTTSWSFLVISLSVLLQAFVYIAMGSLADHGAARKNFMLLFGIGGALCTILMILPTPSSFWLAGLLAILSNTAYGASYVFFLAFIPVLTRWYPEYISVLERYKQGNCDYEKVQEVEEHVGNKISAHANAAGYTSGVLMLLITIGIVFWLGNSVFSLQLGVMLSGVWWLIFSVIPYKYMRARPGPPLPEGQSYVTYSWKRLYSTLTHIKRLKMLFLYLLAWFVLSDGFHTISQVAILFAKRYLNIPQSDLLIIALIVPLVALFGTYFWYYVQIKVLRTSTKSMILLLSLLYLVIPIYGVVGFFTDSFGFHHSWEVYASSVWHGLLLGALGSFCRVLFAELTPKGHESEFFAFFEITDKGSAWVGPAIVALITDHMDMRYSFVFLTFNMMLPILLVFLVKVPEGKNQARDFVQSEVRDDEQPLTDVLLAED